jgi:hypothetical protein
MTYSRVFSNLMFRKKMLPPSSEYSNMQNKNETRSKQHVIPKRRLTFIGLQTK